MKIAEPDRIRKPLPLTPLVDVVFLLLMFFMLTSSFTRFGNLGLTVGTASRAATPADVQRAKPGIILRVFAGPRISVNGEAVEIAALPGVLQSFIDRDIGTAAVQASSGASVQDLVTVLETVRASKLSRVYMIK
jgi:biopolymer transport protein ExbD